jgi:serine/threonine protein kinase
VIGKQSKEQLEFIKEESIVNYTQSLQDSIQAFMLESKFPHIDKEIVELLKQMLIFNPLKRPSAKECLNSSIFDSLRVKALEQDADIKVKLELDLLDLFDYEECVDTLPIEKCHELLMQEI